MTWSHSMIQVLLIVVLILAGMIAFVKGLLFHPFVLFIITLIVFIIFLQFSYLI